MRIAIAKPDWRITGGFELVVGRLAAGLEDAGHAVDWYRVDVPSVPHVIFGQAIEQRIWDGGSEYFRYLAQLDHFSAMDIVDADVVLTTQPPSFAVRHPRQMSLFFHHLRIYYDLSEAYVAAGFVDAELHQIAERHLRAVDAFYLRSVGRFLVSSDEVRQRLALFNGIEDNVVPCRVGLTRDWTASTAHRPPGKHVLCVSRHEFPKRTELFVEAMSLLPSVEAVMVGSGGRAPWVRALHAALVHETLERPVPASGSWLNLGVGGLSDHQPEHRLLNIQYLEHLPDARLFELYRDAVCVVAPAFKEDYGLTALEAMRLGVPVVVCADGGGLVELIEDGVSGLVVDPSGEGIAAAVRELTEDRALAREMGRHGQEAAEAFTWERTMTEFSAALESLLS